MEKKKRNLQISIIQEGRLRLTSVQQPDDRDTWWLMRRGKRLTRTAVPLQEPKPGAADPTG